MVHLYVHHEVEDYAKWKQVFDEHASDRDAVGSKGGWLFRSHDNPNELVILIEYADLEKAREFAQSDGLREAMERAGVKGPPVVQFLDRIEDVPS